jgi:thiol-disulfide isomerase/thioredoxin
MPIGVPGRFWELFAHTREENMPLSVGDLAPAVNGTDVVNNQAWSLQSFAEHHVLLAFSGITWCGPCMAEAPALEIVWQKLNGKANVPFTMAIVSGMFGSPESPQALQNAQVCLTQPRSPFAAAESHSPNAAHSR